MARRRTPRTSLLYRASRIFVLLVGLGLVLFLLRLPLCRLLVDAEVPQEKDYHFEVTADGFSLYRETVLVAPLSGRIEPQVQHGELVPRGTKIAHLVDAEASEAYEERFEKVANQLLAWREDYLEKLQQRTTVASSSADATLDALLQLKYSSASAGDRSDAWGEFVESASHFTASRRQAQELLRGWQYHCQNLLNLCELLTGAEGEMVAVEPGIVLLGSDGLESVLDWEMDLDRRGVARLDSMSARDNAAAFADGEWNVTAGEPVARIAQPDQLHAVLLMPCREGSPLNRGDKVNIYIEEIDEEVEAEILTIGSCHDDSLAVRVSVGQALPEFYTRRSWRAVVRRTVGRGHVISKSQLVERDGSFGVYLWVDDRPKWAPVEVWVSDGDLAVVSGIPRGVAVVVNPGVIISFFLG